MKTNLFAKLFGRFIPHSSSPEIRVSASGAPSAGNVIYEILLLFPLVTTVIALLALLCGGQCAVWQWWLAAAFSLVYAFARLRSSKALWAGGAFLLILAGVWLYAGVSVSMCQTDQAIYHFPAIRLLMGGWNPIWEPTIESMCERGGFLVDDFRPLMVVAMPKAVWIFSAVAAFFTGNQFALFQPILFFMLMATGMAVWKNLGKVNFIFKIVAMFALFYVINKERAFAVDSVVALSFIGLLSCLFRAFRCQGEAMPAVPLVVFSFWLCAGKTTGIPFCVILWLMFFAVRLAVSRQSLRRNAKMSLSLGAAIVVLAVLANISPYITSWIAYTHPLYPKYTCDEERDPSSNVVEDFLEGNEDAAAMRNRTAMFLNAFVCPDLINGYYAWKLDKPDFRPQGSTWEQYGYPGGYDTPLRDTFRYLFLVPILLMLILGRLPERFAALAMIACAFAMPAEMVGYERYVRFINGAFIFALPMLQELAFKRKAAKCAALFAGAVSAVALGFEALNNEMTCLSKRLGLYEIFHAGLPDKIYFSVSYRYSITFANTKLMTDLIPQLQSAKKIENPLDYLHDMAKINREYPSSPDYSFRVPKWYADWLRQRNLQPRSRRPRDPWGAAFYDAQTDLKRFFTDFPRAVWLRLTGELDECFKPERANAKTISEVDIAAESVRRLLDSWQMDVAVLKSQSSEVGIVCEGEGFDTDCPKYLAKDGWQGATAWGSSGSFALRMTSTADADIVFSLRGRHVKKDGKTIPILSDYVSLVVDGRKMLESPVTARQSKAFRIPFHIEAGREILVELKTTIHRYTKDELRELLGLMDECIGYDQGRVDAMLGSPVISDFLSNM